MPLPILTFDKNSCNGIFKHSSRLYTVSFEITHNISVSIDRLLFICLGTRGHAKVTAYRGRRYGCATSWAWC